MKSITVPKIANFSIIISSEWTMTPRIHFYTSPQNMASCVYQRGATNFKNRALFGFIVLQPLPGKEIQGNKSEEARSDISARGFWRRGQRAFFDIRVFDPNAQSLQSKSLQKCYEMNEQEKRENTICEFWTLNKKKQSSGGVLKKSYS